MCLVKVVCNVDGGVVKVGMVLIAYVCGVGIMGVWYRSWWW